MLLENFIPVQHEECYGDLKRIRQKRIAQNGQEIRRQESMQRHGGIKDRERERRGREREGEEKGERQRARRTIKSKCSTRGLYDKH